jgi:sterol desaturase/sphingolipid hydroxylase (fatty acid hydroxylase superfamily)
VLGRALSSDRGRRYSWRVPRTPGSFGSSDAPTTPVIHQLFHALQQLAVLVHANQLAWSAVKAIGVIVILFGLVYIAEFVDGADQTRYHTKNFRNDLIYGLFYSGGFYNVLIGAAIANALGPRLAFFRIAVLKPLPLPVAALIAYIVTDFLQYWVHRFQHHNRFLWAFHSIHHTQERMTFISTYRNHPIDQIVGGLMMFIPLLMLGVPSYAWLPLYVFQQLFEAVQHAELSWRYGRLYPVLVSPVFHGLHHSRSPEHHNRNFSKVLSVWDFWFGTAVRDARPDRTGVEGMVIPESIWAHQVAPFRFLYRWFARPGDERKTLAGRQS